MKRRLKETFSVHLLPLVPSQRQTPTTPKSRPLLDVHEPTKGYTLLGM